MTSFGDWLGNFGNSWQGGEDAPMYADPSSSLTNPGYATVPGVQNYGNAVGDLLPGRGLFLLIGIGIIAFSLLDSD